MTTNSEKRVEVFYSYAHKDEDLRDELARRLDSLQRQGLITAWHDRRIIAGTDWAQTIDEHLNTASIILLLISPHFLASRYCSEIEMPQALKRHTAGEARVVPILLSSLDFNWTHEPFARLQVLPTGGKPITEWKDQNKAFLDVMRGIRRAAEEWIGSSSEDASEHIWHIPYRQNSFFTGQENILSSLYNELEEHVAANLTQPQAISGLGGIGKTQIAIEYAYRFRDKYRVILWVNAASQTALVQSFVAIAHTLHLSEQNDSDASIVVDAVKHWLNTHDQWLLILDNADDESLIHATLPIEANGHILLTTRSQLLGDVVQNIEVKQMSTNDGVLLLLKRARLLPLTATYNELIDAPDRLAAEKLVETLGGLPLALDQAGAYVDQTRCGIAGYLEKYATHRDKLLKERGTKMTTYPESVATTWSLNFQEVETKDKAAIRLLRIYAYLYPDAIPEELEISPMKGTRLPKWLLQSFQLEGLTGDPIAFDQSIKILRAYSLVYRDTREQTLSVHRLVQVVLQDKLSKQWQKVYAENAIHFISHAFPDPRDVTTWSRCERYILHAQTCATWIEKWNLTSQENVTLLSNAGCYLLNRGQYKEAEPLLLLAVSILEQPGKNKSNLALSLNNLGELYWRQGKYEQAEQLMRRSLLILQQQVGPHHILVAGLLNNLAEVYRTQSKYEQATELHQQALTIRKNLLEPDHPDIALSLNNLAGIFHETGKYKQSEEFVQEALSIRERQRGSHDPEVAVSLNDLAELYTVQGKKYEEAEALYKRALIIREEIYGYQHPEVANTLNNLAELYRAQGRYVEAGEFSEQALAIREEILGPDHLDVGVSLNNLAGLYEAQGRYKEAEKFYLRAITITQQSTTSDHPYLGTSLNNLAALYHAWEKYEQAEELYLRAITIAEQKFEKDHPHVIKSLQNYALLLKDMQRDAEAAALEKRIEKIIKPASD